MTEFIEVDGWQIEVTYIESHGKYVAEAFDSDGRKFDYVASTSRDETIKTAVALANAGEYYRPFDSKQTSTRASDDMRDLNADDGSTEQPRQVIQYHEHTSFSLLTFILALVCVAAATFLLSPVIMFILFPQP